MSVVLLIALYGPDSHEQADGEETEHLMSHIAETAATDEDGADGVDEHPLLCRRDAHQSPSPIGCHQPGQRT